MKPKHLEQQINVCDRTSRGYVKHDGTFVSLADYDNIAAESIL